MDDGITLVAQGFEVDVIRRPDQVADVPAFGGHEAEVGPFLGDCFEVHVPAVLMAAIAGAFAFQAFMALHAGQRHVGRHDLVLDPPVHAGIQPLVLAAVRQVGRLHTGGDGFLPVCVLPVGRRVLLVFGKQVRHDQMAVFDVNRHGTLHDFKWRDLGTGILDRTHRFGDVDVGRVDIDLVSQEYALHGSVVPGIDRLGRFLPDKLPLHPVVVIHAILVLLGLAVFVAGLGPVPGNDRRLAFGVHRRVAGVAGDGFAVFVQVWVQQTVAGVRLLAVAVLATETAFGYGHRCAATANFMVAGAVAFRALEVVTAHVDVTTALGVEELAGHIRVLDSLTTTAVEMAVSAGLAAGAAHALGHLHQIHLGIRHAGLGRHFTVGTGPVMTDQAVNFGHIGKIKRCVSVSVSCVTACATSLVAMDADSEIVHGSGGLAVLDMFAAVKGVGRRSFPQPVGGFKHVFTGSLVAAQTFLGHFGRLRLV